MLDLQGTIEDVFGHRFTLKTEGGKRLVDVGPHARDLDALEPGLEVAIKGERKPSEIKAHSLKIGDGEWRDLGRHEHDKGKDADDKPDVSDEDVDKALADAGYTTPGERVRKPKHVEVLATSKDGVRHKVHVHKGAVVKKVEPVG